MKLLVIGGGGREHAIVRKLKENPEVETIYCLPGNGGIAADAVCVADIGAKDIPAQVAFAKSHDIDFAVVAPDDPLVLGAVDALEAAGIPCFGPEAKAAIIEGSKVFSKDLMKKYGIPTAEYQVFTDAGGHGLCQDLPPARRRQGGRSGARKGRADRRGSRGRHRSGRDHHARPCLRQQRQSGSH